jgi:DNA (cytosine-5)-methyltransferase 1
LLTAGFPCTDLSQAGRTAGFAGERSSLIRDVLNLLRKRPFESVLIENVPNWRFLHRGEYFSEVLTALEGLGYRWAYRVLDAHAFGLPQRRLRIFVYATQNGDPRQALFEGNHWPQQTALSLGDAAHGFYWTEGNTGLGWGEDCIPTLKGGSSIGIPAPPAILLPDGKIITPDIRDGERLQGFRCGWTDLGQDENERHKFNQRKRWLLVGNAVNVAVSSWIGERLASGSTLPEAQGSVIELGEKWPSAAWFDGSCRFKAVLSPWPVNYPRKPLAQFLEFSGALLSRRATSGFYMRISRSKLRFKPGFKECVKRHLYFMSIANNELPRRVA